LGVGMIVKLAFLLMVMTATTLGVLGQGKPDLIVTALGIGPDSSGQAVGRVSVTVSNPCRATTSDPSFVLVTFKENDQPGSKSIYFVGSKVRPLKGGESQTLMFDAAASGKQIELTRHVLAEVDPYRKVSEKSESNNWRTLNPPAAGAAECTR
jgi:hypothetical protein